MNADELHAKTFEAANSMKQQEELNRAIHQNEEWWHRRLLSRETRSWLIGFARAAIIFAICFGIALLSKQYPKFYFHAVFAVVAAAVFGGLAWLFRPRQ